MMNTIDTTTIDAVNMTGTYTITLADHYHQVAFDSGALRDVRIRPSMPSRRT